MRFSGEVGIVGAGPAGARAAELLASLGTKVLLLDPKAPWEKPCGGGLTPPLFDEIPELNELRPLARPVHFVRLEASPGEGVTVPLGRAMSILPREVLARWQLARAERAGAEHLPVKVTAIRRAYGAWRMDTSGGEVTVPFLVGADGAASLVRRVASPKFRVELAPTRVAYPRGAGPTPDTAVLRFYSGIAGYLWDFPRPDHRSVGVGVTGGTWRRLQLDGEIDAHRRSSDGCACPGLDRAGAVIGTAQLGHGDYSRIAGDDFALLGDAAGFADPLTGEGIRNAMRSAGMFVEAWFGGDTGGYPLLAEEAFEREFRVARILRRLLFEGDAGLGFVEKATRSRVRYSLAAAVMDSVNEHDAGRLLGRWARAYRAGTGATEAGGARIGSVCPCGCPGAPDPCRRHREGAAAA